VRFVTINMFETVFNEITWDIHGSRPFTPIQAYRDSVGPWFDNGYSTLLEELSQRGMLENTLVVCMGEFGRTPKINPAGGRDHWPQCWTIFFAGGGVRGGQVVGASDEQGGYPTDRPVTPAEVVATIYRSLGIDLHLELPGPQGRPVPIVDPGVREITELF
jgi:arylsulfatase A-like enzyme